MVVPDDRELQRLAADPPAPLFPILRRAGSMTSLVVLIAILPSLLGLRAAPLQPAMAEWGLESLAWYEPGALLQFFNSSGDGVSRIPESHPPLSGWITAASLQLPVSPLVAVQVPGAVACAGVVWMVFLLARTWYGSRVAWWTALLLGLHGPFLIQAQLPLPISLGVFWCLVSWLGLEAHRRTSSTLGSWWLLLGGCALGACWLSSGTAAVMAFVVPVLHTVTLRGRVPRRQSKSPKDLPPSDMETPRHWRLLKQLRRQPRTVWVGWPAIQSIAIWAATAFALGGWWALMQSGSQITNTLQTAFRVDWLQFGHADWWWSRLADFSRLTGGLVGLCTVGVIDRKVRVESTVDTCLLSSWRWGVGLLWLMQPTGEPDIIESIFLLALVMTAAIAIEQVVLRHTDITTHVAIVMITFVSCTAWLWWDFLAARFSLLVAWLLVVGFVSILGHAIRQMDRRFSRRETIYRRWLKVWLAVIVCGSATVGISASQSRTEDDAQLALICKALSAGRSRPVSTVAVADEQLPVRLQFVLQSFDPAGHLQTVRSGDPRGWESIADSTRVRGPGPMIVRWGNPIAWRSLANAPQLTEIVPPSYFAGRPVTVYELLDREVVRRQSTRISSR